MAGTTMCAERPQDAWHLDKRVPIAFIAAILLQTFGALVWAGQAAGRMAHIEAEAMRVQDLAERAARLEVQMASVQAALGRIETKLDRWIGTPADPMDRNR